MDHLKRTAAFESSICNSLTCNLRHFYHHGEPDQAQLDIWKAQALSYVGAHCTPSETHSAHLAVERAIAQALATYQCTSSELERSKPSASKERSFSLLQSLSDSGGGLASFVNWDRVSEAETLHEKLKLMEEVQYIDDVVLDWNRFREVLLGGLRSSSLTQKSLLLHRKWFELTRSSASQYQVIQSDLAMNLKILLGEIAISRADLNDTAALETIRLLHSIWMNFMLRGDRVSAPPAELIESIGSAFWDWSKSFFEHDEKPSQSLGEMLFEIDPYTGWFQLWIKEYFSALQVLERFATAKDDCDFLSKLTVKVWEAVQRNGFNLYIQCGLCIVWGVLSALRVRYFPWKSFLSGGTVAPDDSTIEWVYDIFLYCSKEALASGHDDFFCVAADAMSILLPGCSPEFRNRRTVKQN
jgi:hypothetical protein